MCACDADQRSVVPRQGAHADRSVAGVTHTDGVAGVGVAIPEQLALDQRMQGRSPSVGILGGDAIPLTAIEQAWHRREVDHSGRIEVLARHNRQAMVARLRVGEQGTTVPTSFEQARDARTDLAGRRHRRQYATHAVSGEPMVAVACPGDERARQEDVRDGAIALSLEGVRADHDVGCVTWRGRVPRHRITEARHREQRTVESCGHERCVEWIAALVDPVLCFDPRESFEAQPVSMPGFAEEPLLAQAGGAEVRQAEGVGELSLGG